ncbi:MAG: VOC family protein [Mycobacteriales bacterium]
MTVRLGSVVINCADIESMTAFWSAALGLAPSSEGAEDDFRVLRGDRVNVSLQLADTPVSGRDQMHLDLYATDQQQQVARLTALGATYLRHNADPQDDFVVMADPEGNEFCVCQLRANEG